MLFAAHRQNKYFSCPWRRTVALSEWPMHHALKDECGSLSVRNCGHSGSPSRYRNALKGQSHCGRPNQFHIFCFWIWPAKLAQAKGTRVCRSLLTLYSTLHIDPLVTIAPAITFNFHDSDHRPALLLRSSSAFYADPMRIYG